MIVSYIEKYSTLLYGPVFQLLVIYWKLL